MPSTLGGYSSGVCALRGCVTAVFVGVVLAAGTTTTAAAAAPARSVNVDMVDIAFEPTVVTATAGERVVFRFKNRGEATHDAFIGTAKAQRAHEREMRKAERDDDGHGSEHGGNGSSADVDAVTVKPGKTAKLSYTFTEPGTLEIGCHEPGHYKAGMKIVVTVA